ncbi:MAG: DNA recombination protein RmuC [Ruminococcus sp.]|nr:DNA recombination protein RmuC [Ruminococcus sp.]
METITLLLSILSCLLSLTAVILILTKKETQNNQALLDELRSSRQETAQNIQSTTAALGSVLQNAQAQSADVQDKRLSELNDAIRQQQILLRRNMNDSLSRLEEEFHQLSVQTERRLSQMQNANEKKLEEMRATVDEKLQKTLEERMNQSFALVSKNLEAVSKGLGEMKTLAGDVSGLKRVLSNVKTCGILGELQLEAILREILSPDQYETNVATVPDSANRVEFAIRLPGSADAPVYLPIDSKFPMEAYRQLLDAEEDADAESVSLCRKTLCTRIKQFAKDIHEKYVAPPHTTEFAILFLPVEGLYAEAVRCGMIEELQQKYRVIIAGPTTMAALLNSLQMGFRTLAIQKRSGEVWQLLSAVKTEFEKFGASIEAAQKKLRATSDELDKLVGVRTRAINNRLRTVTELSDEISSCEVLGLSTDSSGI